jgi:hypothetical protein
VSVVSPNGVIFYTDGSLLNGQAGAGLYSESLAIGEAHALGCHATVFQPEVYAILACSEQ